MTGPENTSGDADKNGSPDKNSSSDMNQSSDTSGNKGEPTGTPEGSTPAFGSPFDYDATAEASLSQTPGSSDATPTGSGPGWDTYSGVGNGPGWGSTPTYPSPTDAYPNPGEPGGPVYGAPDPNLGQQYGRQSYEQPAPGFPQGQQPYPGQPYPGGQPYPAMGYQPGHAPIPGAYPDAMAPFGRHPLTGEPYSDKSKLTAGLLELFLGAFGAGRFYLNQPGIAVAQIAVTWLTCGIGGIWPLIDAVMMLVGNVKDEHGRPLRD